MVQSCHHNDSIPATSPKCPISEFIRCLLSFAANSSETSAAGPASQLSEPHQRVARRTLAALKTDSAIHLDALAEQLNDCSPSEIIAALFELELAGKVKQMPGKNFVKSF